MSIKAPVYRKLKKKNYDNKMKVLLKICFTYFLLK